MVSSRDEAIQFEKHFERAQGWLALGKVDEAARALDEIPDSYRQHTPVAAFRCELLLASKQWDLAARLAERLVEIEPEEARNWIHWAYAVRRGHAMAEAEKILHQARKRHPKCGTIPFNLACYAAQSGRLNEVADLLRSAIQLEPALRLAARADPDLQPYWASRAAAVDQDPAS